MAGEWTYREFKRVVITALEIEDRDSVKLDCGKSTADNISQVVKWAEQHGYHAVVSSNKEIVTVHRTTPSAMDDSIHHAGEYTANKNRIRRIKMLGATNEVTLEGHVNQFIETHEVESISYSSSTYGITESLHVKHTCCIVYYEEI